MPNLSRHQVREDAHPPIALGQRRGVHSSTSKQRVPFNRDGASECARSLCRVMKHKQFYARLGARLREGRGARRGAATGWARQQRRATTCRGAEIGHARSTWEHRRDNKSCLSAGERPTPRTQGSEPSAREPSAREPGAREHSAREPNAEGSSSAALGRAEPEAHAGPQSREAGTGRDLSTRS